jgi:peptide deformylase
LVYDWEGCFSVKETTGKVPRYNVISYFAQTPEGVLINAIAKGFTARVLQHEIDHIQGVLITHRLTPDCLQGHPDDMMILRFQEFSPEQQELVKQIIAQREQNLDPNDKATMEALENVKKYLNKNE